MTYDRRSNLLLRRLAVRSRRLHILQHWAATASSRCQHGKRNGRNHEYNGTPGRRLGQHGGCATRTKSGLATHSTESGSDIAALSALQQDNNDQEQTNDDVNDNEQGVENHTKLVLGTFP